MFKCSSCYLRKKGNPLSFPLTHCFLGIHVSLCIHILTFWTKAREAEWRLWGRGVTRTGPGRELSYQVQPILCASAVQRQWIVESVQYCAKFTLDKVDINVLLNGCYYTAVFKLTTVSKISNHLYKLFNISSWSSCGVFCRRKLVNVRV